ncbi:MAG TPA: energy transducer TonB [Stellaceae bacterium]
MAAATYRDDPWQRLPWLVPAALALSLLSVTGFLALLAGPAYVPSAPAPVEMQVIELPPSPVVMPPLPEAEPPPPPPVVEPEPLPLPEVKAEPPPPPPKPRPRPAKPPPSPPPPQAAAPAAPAPAAPPAAAPPDGGNMGARVLYQPKPEIPEQLRRRSLELAALARFHIAADGSAQVELVEPTPDPDLNRSLMETLKKWRFFPELRNGKPVASTLDIRIPISVR